MLLSLGIGMFIYLVGVNAFGVWLNYRQAKKERGYGERKK